jgi:hypothetical protein
MESRTLRIRGKTFGPQDIKQIQEVVNLYPGANWRRLSERVCECFGWRQPSGQWQDRACREILQRLELSGHVVLPPPDPRGGARPRRGAKILELPLEDKQPSIEGRLNDYPPVFLQRVEEVADSHRWNVQMSWYHYLGHRPLVGRVMKYRICLGAQEVGLLGWASPSWKLASRDAYIGWDAATRERNLQGLANNHRFLIYPWVRIKNLASHVLGVAVRRVREDWWEKYRVRLYLLESFVDPSRFRGTCYRAANWVYLGQSRGFSKRGNGYVAHGQAKDVYVYPLVSDFRERLREASA